MRLRRGRLFSSADFENTLKDEIMGRRRVAVVGGVRTPFVKSGKAFANIGPLDLAKYSVTGLIKKNDVDPQAIESLVYGLVVPEKGKPNLAREIILESDLPNDIEAQTLSSYCITGLRAVTAVVEGIANGRLECGIAGGVEWLSGAQVETFQEPSTGLSMGQHGEMMCQKWNIPRARQDELAVMSHRKAIASRDLLSQEIVAVKDVHCDSGPRPDTSTELLSGLRTVFDKDGSLTAGNSSPVSDGASAVLLMSEERAKLEGREALAFIRAMEYAAINPRDGLLMAPAVAVPSILKRCSLTLSDLDLIEIHEAFSAQVLANVWAWEQGWRANPLGPLDWDKINVNGGSVAIGHPWSATGGRILTTLANEMYRRDVNYGLISICAAGAMAGAFVLERS